MAHFTDMLITINNADYVQAKKFRLKKNGRVEKVPGVGVDLSKFDKEQRKTEKGEGIRLSLRKTWNIDPSAFVLYLWENLMTTKIRKWRFVPSQRPMIPIFII